MLNKTTFFVGMILLLISPAHAQYKKTAMHSNKRNILLLINGEKNDWIINPAVKPDVLTLYSLTDKSKKIRFISDIDSIEFNVEVNKPLHFSIIYNGDTAHTAIEFTNYIPSTLNDSEKLYALSLFWSEAKYNFAFIDKLTFDWDSLYLQYIPKILETTNDYQFYDVMRLFASSLKDAHTGVYYHTAGSYTDYVPILAHFFGNELRIITVREDIANTFPVGSKIIGINGMTVDQYMEKEIIPYVDSDLEYRMKASSAFSLFSSKLHSDTIRIKYITPDQKILSNTVPRDGKIKPGASVGYQSQQIEKPIDINWLDNNIAVLGFHTFNDYNGKLIPYFESLKDTLYSAKGIIIDIRNNGGGGTNVAWHLLQYIVKDPFFLNFAWQTRINDGVKKANGNWNKENEAFYKNIAYRTVPADTIFITDSVKRFDVPIIILTSLHTASAAEDFLIILYERPDRPLIVGRPSLGSTGSPLIVCGFPDNGFAKVCARRVLFPYSMKPFTSGIVPDILVEYSFEDVMSGYDKDIEVAVKELNKIIAGQK